MSERITISLKDDVLSRLDEYSDRLGMTRSGLISTAVSQYIDACEIKPKFQQSILDFTNGLQSLVKGEITQDEFTRLCDEIEKRK